MKELSIEEKAKAYDEAIEKAKNCLKDGTITNIAISYIETIFPELKESEDEESKKWILEYLYDGMRMSDEQFKDQFKSAISWLEKQGKKESQVKCPTFTFNDILALQCCMETVKKVQKDKDLYEKLNDLHGRVYDAYHFEKQGEVFDKKVKVMKANEAPEKIYLEWYRIGDEKYRDWVITPKTNNEPIEYTRTDAFIEKACEWLSRHFYNKEYEIRDDEGVWIDADCLIEDFEKYLKE